MEDITRSNAETNHCQTQKLLFPENKTQTEGCKTQSQSQSPSSSSSLCSSVFAAVQTPQSNKRENKIIDIHRRARAMNRCYLFEGTWCVVLSFSYFLLFSSLSRFFVFLEMFFFMFVVASGALLSPHRHGDRSLVTCTTASLSGKVLSSVVGPFQVAAFGNSGSQLSVWTSSSLAGDFALHYEAPRNLGLVFVLAKKGNVHLIAVVHKSRPANIFVNANTTVAAAYGLAQFLGLPNPATSIPLQVSGSFIGTKTAGQVAFVLADSRTGQQSIVLQDSFNSQKTTTQVDFFLFVCFCLSNIESF